MARNTSERVLNEMVQGTGRGSILKNRLVANRDRNWFLALTLHAFAKKQSGGDLSDLESTIISAYSDNGFTEEDIAAQADLWHALPDEEKSALFPEKYANLADDESYSLQDLGGDADDIITAMEAMPITTKIDVDAILDESATARDFPTPPNSVLHQYASRIIIAKTSDAVQLEDNPRSFMIKAHSFHCIDRASDSKFGPSNEVFWIFGAVGAGENNTTNTGVFGDVDNGETFRFSSSEGCIWSRDCTRAPLPEGDIGVFIQLWEHDEGDIGKAREGVAAAFAAASGVLAATGVAAWVGAVTAGVGAVTAWLIGFAADDHIADETVIFNRGAIEPMVPDTRGARWDVVRKFSDGDANYDLTIRVSGRPGIFGWW